MQIAKMFATLGFNVDLTGLNQFKEALKGARADTALLSRNARVLKNNLDSVNKTLVSLNGNLRLKKTDSKISGTYIELKNAVVNADKALTSISNNQPTITKSLGKIHRSIIYGESKWKRYADEVQRTKELLKDVKGKMVELRQNSTVSLRVNGSGGSNGNRSQSGGGGGFFGGMMMGGMGNARNPFSFFRSILPSVALAGAIPAAGYVTKEVVIRGREQQKMESVLRFSTESLESFNDSLKFVRQEGERLGLNTAELGKAFAQVQLSGQGRLTDQQIKKFFTNTSEFMMTAGLNSDDQKAVFKTLNQMFSLGKIEMDELNELAGRGLPRSLVYQVARDVYGLKTDAEVSKLQQAGKLDPFKVMIPFMEKMAKKAHDTGAFDTMMQSSQTKQNIASVKFDHLSRQIMEAGLDKALANLFDGLSKLITLITDFSTAVKAAYDGIAAFGNLLGGKGILYTALVILAAILLKNVKMLSRLEGGVGKAQQTVGKFRNFLANPLMKTIIAVGKRFFWFISLFSLFSSIGKALNESATGKVTWMDIMMANFDLMIVKVELFFTLLAVKAISTGRILKAAMNPLNWTKEWQSKGTFAAIGDFPNNGKGGVPNKNASGDIVPRPQAPAFIPYAAPIPKIDLNNPVKFNNPQAMKIEVIDKTSNGIQVVRNGDIDNPAFGWSG